jgi:cell wall assembly regulator SMI1
MPISYGKPANKDEIKVLERKFKISLPEDYKEFLRLKNGFVVKSRIFVSWSMKVSMTGLSLFMPFLE